MSRAAWNARVCAAIASAHNALVSRKSASVWTRSAHWVFHSVPGGVVCGLEYVAPFRFSEDVASAAVTRSGARRSWR